MKRVLFILSLLAFLTVIFSCSKKQTEEGKIAESSVTEKIETPVQEVESVEEKKEPVVFDFSIPWEPAADDKPDDPASAYQQVNTMDKAPEHLTEEYLVRNWQIEILSTGVNFIYFKFGRGGNYRVVSPFGGYLGYHGKYEIQEDKVILHTDGNDSGWIQYYEVFPEGKDIVLEYDYNYKDYANVGVLKNDKIICRSGVELQKAGTICWKNDIEVEKLERIYLVPSDNMKLRENPDLKAKEKKYNYTGWFWSGSLKEAGEEYMIPNADNPEYSIYMNKYDCLLKGKIISSVFKTTKQDTVEGVTAPWYLITLTPAEDESWPEDYWVYGGFMETLGKEVNEKDRATYARILVDEGLKRGHLVIDEEKLTEENARKMEPVINEVASSLYKKGGHFENNDLLQDSPVKIGMTLSELQEKYGKIPSYKQSGNTYNYYGSEWYFEVTVTDGKVESIQAGYIK